MLDEFGELKKRYWGQHLWGIGYGAWSTVNITDEMIEMTFSQCIQTYGFLIHSSLSYQLIFERANQKPLQLHPKK